MLRSLIIGALFYLGLCLVFFGVAHSESPLTKSVDIYMRGDVTQALAYTMDDSIRALNDAGFTEIRIHITSPGGSVYAGLQIYDSMARSKAKIHTICEGYCMSMAAVILTGGDIREADPNATIMFHELSSQSNGHLSEMRMDLEESERLQNLMDRIIHDHSGLSMSAVRKMESYDHFMSAEDARALRLIDGVRHGK